MSSVADQPIACLALAHAGKVIQLEREATWIAIGEKLVVPEIYPPYDFPEIDREQMRREKLADQNVESARTVLAVQHPVCLDGAICQLLAMFRELRRDSAVPERLKPLSANACSFLSRWADDPQTEQMRGKADFTEWLVMRLLCDPLVRSDEEVAGALACVRESLMARAGIERPLDPGPGLRAFEARMVRGSGRNLSRHAFIGGWPLPPAEPLPPAPDPNRPFVMSARALRG
ncbi:MAG: hypothetical protein GC196_01230 [Hyphomonas sp.]|nr:hypothetical protein [Hyphomonas sp.]